jgi:phosphoenolpyruvate carboxykinase (ATP)
LLCGTDTGEMKRDIFCIELHIARTQKNTYQCTCKCGDEGDTAIFFGFLEQENNAFCRPKKKLIDDEHGWTNENTVFNFEGGCYAKVINLSERNQIFSESKRSNSRKCCFEQRFKSSRF